MLPKKSRRQDTTTLIWEYLEGEISPSRAERLSRTLAERAEAREQLVESAVLHGMLHDFFKQGSEQRSGEDRPCRSSAA